MKPYMEPAMRRKMGVMDAPPAPDAPTDETEGGAGDNPEEESSEGEKPTAFLSKEMGGGKQYKEGDEIVLTVDAVDPETGELQVSCAPGESDEPSDEPTDTMSAMDKAMPDDGNS
jgi:hypothetical protein